MRSRWHAVAGVALAVGLLGWLVWRLEDRNAMLAVFSEARGRPWALLGGVAFFGASLGCGTLRWGFLLRALSLPISGSRVLQLYAVGHFFNAVVPGSTGGDVVKAACAAKDSPGRRPEAVASIVVERVVGLLALCVLAAGVALARADFFAGTSELRLLRGMALLLGVGALLGAGVLFGIDWSRWFPETEDARGWRKAVAVLVRAYRAMRLCMRHPMALGSTFGLSLANHLCAVGCAACLGHALGLPVPVADYLVVIPLVNAVAAVPLTPGGAGVRESASVVLLTVAGATAAQATALSLLVYGVIVAWALVGGLCYLALRKQP